METKLSKLRAAAAAGDWRTALAIAARFQDLGEHDAAIRRAHQAQWHPEWSRQLGRDPHDDIEAGIAALHDRFNLGDSK